MPQPPTNMHRLPILHSDAQLPARQNIYLLPHPQHNPLHCIVEDANHFVHLLLQIRLHQALHF